MLHDAFQKEGGQAQVSDRTPSEIREHTFTALIRAHTGESEMNSLW